ncbi:MAG: hypothetical protein ABMB14_29725 [Myxococcota bacterium]
MIRWFLGLDALVARTRPAWAWIGQLAVVLLGVHLACDRLDDGITSALAGSGIPWPEPDQPLTVGTWTAVLFELYVAGWMAVASFRAYDTPAFTLDRAGLGSAFAGWSARATPHAVAAPIAWAATTLAGAWVIGMAIEDAVAGWWAPAASPAGWIGAIVVAARLGWPGLVRIARQTPIPGHRWDGAITIWPALLVAGLAIRYGLPLWGWLT